jgi:hypothetical protein
VTGTINSTLTLTAACQVNGTRHFGLNFGNLNGTQDACSPRPTGRCSVAGAAP